MAIVRVTLGNRSAENVAISSVSGAGPWTVTLGSAPSADTVIGDTLTDEAASPNSYLITGISGADLTVRDAFGVSTAPSDAAASQATTVRSYAHPVAANVDADDGGIYTVGDVAEWAVCEKINVTALQTISGGGILGLSKIHILSEETYAHDGSIGTTGIIERATDPNGGIFDITTAVDVEISGLVLLKTPSSGTYNSGACIQHSNASSLLRVHHNIIAGTAYAAANGGNLAGVWINVGSSVEFHIHNNVIYGFGNATTGTGWGIYIPAGISTSSTVYNNTVYGCLITGIDHENSLNRATVSNNISMGNTGADFGANSFSGTSNNNYASDTSAPGGLSLQSQVVADTFVDYSTADLHIKPTANARTAGANLEGAGNNIETDIDGETRPGSAIPWDIGADWYQAAPLAGIPCTGIVNANMTIGF